MKYYVWKSKTPILDSCVVIFIVVLFLSGFGEIISINLFGVDWNAKSDGTNAIELAACGVIFLMISFIVCGVLFARFIAHSFFSVSVGDSRVELDTEKRESSTYTDGKLESKETWDKPKGKGVKF